VKESELSVTHLVFAMKGHNHNIFLRRSHVLRQALCLAIVWVLTNCHDIKLDD
jgi:hypothetical protein